MLFTVAGPSVLYLLPGSTPLLLLTALTITLIVMAILGLRTPVGRVLVTAGGACSPGSSPAMAGGPASAMSASSCQTPTTQPPAH